MTSLPVPRLIQHGDALNIAQVFDKFLDKNKRARNVVVHNLPEQSGGSQAERSQADIALFTSMVREALHMNVRATRSFRV
ncbi:MAG: hypothetical protein AAF638_10610, partial [Pseudomonadota bacterium]